MPPSHEDCGKLASQRHENGLCIICGGKPKEGDSTCARCANFPQHEGYPPKKGVTGTKPTETEHLERVHGKAKYVKPHKHAHKLLKKFRWLGTDNYILVHGCIECGDVRAGAIDMKWIPASREEIDEANRVADSLMSFARGGGK